MVLDEALYRYLSGVSALTALVADRIYPIERFRGGALPALTFQRISGPRVHCMGSDPGLQYPRYQVNVFASTPESMWAVAAQVQAALQDYSGTMGGEGGVTVQRVFFDDDGDLGSEEPDAEVFGRRLDFIIWAQE